VSRRRLEILLWTAAAALALLAWRRVRDAVPPVPAAAPPGATAQRPLPARASPAALAAAAQAARRGNPFRLDRSPAPVRYAVAPVPGLPVPPPPPPAPPRSALTLAGVVGPPWQALVQGIPGRSGAVVVRAGDRIDDLRVLSVTRDRAVIQGTDTTWRLTLKGNSP
jgi:hypothetical protein